MREAVAGVFGDISIVVRDTFGLERTHKEFPSDLEQLSATISPSVSANIEITGSADNGVRLRYNITTAGTYTLQVLLDKSTKSIFSDGGELSNSPFTGLVVAPG